MRALTVRNVPPDVADALAREKQRRGKSLNQTVIELLAQGLGVAGPRSNGLGQLSGTWSEQDLREFSQAVSPLDDIDPELWR